MRATAPIMSGFIIYLLGVATAAVAIKRVKQHLFNGKYAAAGIFVLIAIGSAIFSLAHDERPVYANSKTLLGPNQPIGVAKGIFPGRVVWVLDADATNENCTNAFGDGWFLPQNTNLEVVDKMAADAVKRAAGKETIAEAWDALFRYFNQHHRKGDVGYSGGEKIYIKVNHVSASSNTFSDDYTIRNTNRYGMAETSPQLVLAVLRQLVNEYSIPDSNIAVGDPMKHIYKHVYEMWHGEFPNVAYIDYRGAHGRTKPVAHSQASIYYSDRGHVLKDGSNPVISDYLPAVMVEADYMINIAALKGHARAGITLCAKNHFGSNTRSSAAHLHEGLVSPNKTPTRSGYGLYRVQVDLIAHEKLGRNTVLLMVDGLWAGSEANDPPRKFRMPPFNNDWASSIFVAQDEVALESVCFDFLKTEFTAGNPYGSYPQYEGTDDYLVQAADSSYWPDDIQYDPEKDGTVIGSQGVHEHWNDAINKQYSRNLATAEGIELLLINNNTTGIKAALDDKLRLFMLQANYPNPFNGATTISYELREAGFVQLEVHNSLGQKIRTLVSESQTAGLHRVIWNGRDGHEMDSPSGVYYVRLRVGEFSGTVKLLLMK
jgi:hypothetical protein